MNFDWPKLSLVGKWLKRDNWQHTNKSLRVVEIPYKQNCWQTLYLAVWVKWQTYKCILIYITWCLEVKKFCGFPWTLPPCTINTSVSIKCCKYLRDSLIGKFSTLTFHDNCMVFLKCCMCTDSISTLVIVFVEYMAKRGKIVLTKHRPWDQSYHCLSPQGPSSMGCQRPISHHSCYSDVWSA